MGAEILFEAIRQSERLEPSKLSELIAQKDVNSLWKMYDRYHQYGGINLVIDILLGLITVGEDDAYQLLLEIAKANLEIHAETSLLIIDHIFYRNQEKRIPGGILGATGRLRKKLLRIAHINEDALLEAEVLLRINNHRDTVLQQARKLIKKALRYEQYTIGNYTIIYAMKESGMTKKQIDLVKEKMRKLSIDYFDEDEDEDEDEDHE